jgi:hypothetical protein
LIFKLGSLEVRACDCNIDPETGETFVECVDVLINGKTVLCENINTNESYGLLVRELFKRSIVVE